jgi:hypothetical protein
VYVGDEQPGFHDCAAVFAAAGLRCGETVEVSALLTERSELLLKLVDIDPNHRHRYKYLLLNTVGAK